MLHFDSDYMEGCHPEIIKKLAEINMDKIRGMVQIPIVKVQKKRF